MDQTGAHHNNTFNTHMVNKIVATTYFNKTMSIRFYNTLTKRKDTFAPINPDEVKMFVCGPTVYDLSHIGHAKTYTQFDFVARLLKMHGYKVQYLQNITDVDDKIILRANQTNTNTKDLAQRFQEEYEKDMQALGNTSVTKYAPAHNYIDAIVKQVQQLTNLGYAYQLDDGWYFDTTKFKGYGKLSGRTDVQAEDSVARIDEHSHKHNPGDFAVWKMRKPDEPYWKTPIGEGRPGWHIEDTAITDTEFGPQYDLHGGAIDLIFPHHENEIAQMEAASGKSPMVRHWLHAGLLRVKGAKMAKSADNFTTIRDMLERADFRTLRYIFLSQHYRSSVEMSDDLLESALSTRRRVENFYRSIEASPIEDEAAANLAKSARIAFLERLDDDLDTPGALAIFFEYIRGQNRIGTPGASAKTFVEMVQELFGAFDIVGAHGNSAHIEALIEQRSALRAAHKFDEADTVRNKLLRQGVQIKDTENGTKWWHSTDSV